MGRHGQPPPRRAVPWDLVGWGLFATAVAIGVALWAGGTWVVAVFIAITGGVGLGLIAMMSMTGPRE